MTHCRHWPGGLGSIIIVSVFFPGNGLAQTEPPRALPGTMVPAQPPALVQPPAPEQPPALATPVRGPDGALPGSVRSGIPYGPGHWHCSGYQYGPRVAPDWRYQGLESGPFVTYPWGAPGYAGRSAHYGPHGLSLYGPPVPVYGPIPSMFNPNAAVYPGRNVSGPGFVYGWIGPFPASPRPRLKTVSVWSSGTSGGQSTGPARAGACLSLSVTVPQSAAEVFVNGVKTTQTGTDRLYDSPTLEAGQEVRYEVTARWIERGLMVEKKKTVIGSPGELVKLDFTTPEVTTAGK